MREEEEGVNRGKHYSSESQQRGHLKTGLLLPNLEQMILKLRKLI